MSYASPEILSGEPVLGMANTQKVENDLSFGWYLHFKESLAIVIVIFLKYRAVKELYGSTERRNVVAGKYSIGDDSWCCLWCYCQDYGGIPKL